MQTQSKMTPKYSVFFAYLTNNCWLNVLSEILIDLRIITTFVYLWSSTVKHYWQAAHGALLAKHRAELWAGIYCPPPKNQKQNKTKQKNQPIYRDCNVITTYVAVK